ncbi:MAG: PDZ domain-containing protein [Gemmatimonadaceae bacterium]
MRRLILPMFLLAAAAPVAGAQSTGQSAPRARTYTWTSRDDSDRAMLGISTGGSGRRDTLGLFIESITDGSPADKAGLEEGNRIASINGVNLKVAREDAGDSDMSGAMTSRLVREMRKIKAGDEVTLQVWSDGHYKSVKVKTVAAKELEANDGSPDGFAYSMNGADAMVIAPRVRETIEREMPQIRENIQREMPRIREELEAEMPRIREQLQTELPRVREEINNVMPTIREQLDRDMPNAIDEVRRSMDKMRIELPRMTMRLRHRVVI